MTVKVKGRFIDPMLLLRTDALPNEGSRWEYQLKFDGYRAIAFKTGGKIHLRSRNDNDFSIRYSGVVKGLAKLPDETVIDGEVIALDDDGRPSFNILQNYGSSKAPVLYFVFDVMVLAGRDVMHEPLATRRELLEKKILPKLGEEKIPAAFTAALTKLVRDLAASESAFQAAVDSQIPDEVRQGPNSDVFARFVAELDAVRKPLDVAVRGISDAAQAAEGRLIALAKELAERHAVQEADYRTILAASEEQGGRTAERASLQTSLANAQAAATDQLAKETQRQGLATARHELLKRASELRDQRFSLRKRVAERLTSQFPTIRVTVVQAAELEQYRELVADALKGAGVQQRVVAERLAQTFLPSELATREADGDRCGHRAAVAAAYHPSPDRVADEGVHRSEPAGRAGHP